MRLRVSAGVRTLTLLVLLSSAGSAQFSISPQRVDIQLATGAKRTLTFAIYNEDPAKEHVFRYYPAGFTQKSNGAYCISQVPDMLHSCRDWFRLDTTDVLLKPGEMKEVKVDIVVPARASGTRFGAVVFKMLAGNRSREGASVDIGVVAPAFVHVTIPGQNNVRRVKVVKLEAIAAAEFRRFLPKGNTNNVMGFVAVLANAGPVITEVRGEVTVRDNNGKVKRQFPLGSGSILPGATVELLSVIPSLPNGSYRAEVTARYGNPSPLRASAPFTVMNSGSRFDAVSTAAEVNVVAGTDLIELKASPGGFHSGVVTLRNTGADTAIVTARLVPLGQNNQGELLPVDSPANRDCRTWISLDTETLALEPGRARVQRLTYRVPSDAKGSYYACLLVEPEVRAKVNSFVSVPLLVDARGGERKAELADIRLTDRPLHVSARIANEGEVYLRPKITMLVSRSKVNNPTGEYDWTGVGTFNCDQNGAVILPNRTLDVTGTYHEPLPPGRYRVAVVVDCGQGLVCSDTKIATLK